MNFAPSIVRATSIALAAAMLASCSRREEATDEPAGEPTPSQHEQSAEPSLALDETAQTRIGLTAEAAAPVAVQREIKGYGRVLDPAPLAALANELAAARATATVSRQELERLTALSAQNNASARALETARAAAARNDLLVASARDRLTLAWGETLADNTDLPALVQSLVSLESALVRVDLPPGERMSAPPSTARLLTLADEFAAADFVGRSAMVDPQTQGEGLLFLVRTNAARLAPGSALIAYVPEPGEPLRGVVVPRSAVIRYEGTTWIYVRRGGTNFVRRPVLLEQPVENGWLARRGVNPGDAIVTAGAPTLLSDELSRGGFLSGERE